MSTLIKSLPEKIWPGSGTARLLSGYTTDTELLKDVHIQTDANLNLSSSTMLQMATEHIDDCCLQDKPRSCLLSGFTSLVRFPEVTSNTNLSVETQAEFSGKRRETIEQGRLELLSENGISKAAVSFRRTDAGQRTVICLACWEPDPERLKRQIDSIKSQTIKSWHCIINDDASSDESWLRVQEIIGDDKRFSLFRNEENLGFYANFEMALSRVPADVDFVALADQDDDWYPEKLATCMQAFDDEVMLVYCDMRIVDENSEVKAETYWTGRKNNFQDADVLFLANTVTGAASVFRRSLLDTILPFPQAIGQVFHDHWIACVARCKGKLAYVDEALYDYYQYGSSVIGHCDFEARGMGQRAVDLAASVRYLGRLGKFKSWLLHKRNSGLNVFHNEYLRLYLFAEILKLRLPGMQSDAAQGLQMFSAGWSAIFCLLAAHIRIVLKKETTDDAEMRLAAAVFIYRLDRIVGSIFGGRIVKRYCRPLGRSN